MKLPTVLRDRVSFSSSDTSWVLFDFNPLVAL